MAWTVSTLRKDVVGSAREVILSCTADSAEQAVDTGLSYVYGFSVGQVSCSTGAPHIRMNQGSTSTALNGFLGCSGFASGDVLLITVKGR
jgi:hypothetical protein